MSEQAEQAAVQQEEEVLFAPEEKFANPRDHLGRTAAEFAVGCKKGDECMCPECKHPLLVRSGERISCHFAHAKGRANTGCKGAFETPWHFAAKVAASNREGWQREWNDGEWRYDAYNTKTGEVFEAVHSLSKTYITKQRYIASTGRKSVWLFDSAAEFCQQSRGLRLDIKKAFVGILFCSDILKPKTCDLIDELGPERCYLHYLGLAWKCVGRGEWRACLSNEEISRVIYGHSGLNSMLIDMRASGDYPETKVWFRDGADLVSTSWSEITADNLVASVRNRYDTMYQEWLSDNVKRSQDRRRRNRRQRRPATAVDVATRPTPVCGMPAKGLTDAQLATAEQIAVAIALSHRQEACTVSNQPPNQQKCFPHSPAISGLDHRGWCEYYCENCGKWLGYAPGTGGTFFRQLCDARGGQ